MTGRPDRPTALLRDSAGFTLWSVDSSVGVSPSDSWRLEATSLLKPGWLDTPDRAVVFFHLGRERLTRIQRYSCDRVTNQKLRVWKPRYPDRHAGRLLARDPRRIHLG